MILTSKMAMMIKIAIIISIAMRFKSCSCSNCLSTISSNVSSANIPWYIPEDYDSSKDPFDYQNLSEIALPWTFTYDNWVMEITEVDDKRQRISFIMYFSVEWYDPRIVIKLNSTIWKDSIGNMKYRLELPLGTDVWIPDLDIDGLRSFNVKRIHTKMAVLTLTSRKNLKYAVYADVSVTCNMNFTHFPFDEQFCEFLVTSYSRSNDAVKCESITTTGDEFKDYPQRNLQYEITWDSKNLRRYKKWKAGTWEYCGFRIHLERLRTKYLAEAYTPAILFVVISWISFTIKPDAIPGRMMLLLNTFLILVILATDIKAGSPDVTRINKIDIYIGSCILHVFAALMEYAILLIIMKAFNLEWRPIEKDNNFESKRSMANVSKVDPLTPPKAISRKSQNFVDPSKKSTSFYKDLSVNMLHTLDWISLLLFPLSFITFNLCYWYTI